MHEMLIKAMETHRMPPGQTMDDWLTGFRCGIWRLEYGFKLSPEGHRRYFGEFMPLLHQTKHDVLGDFEDDSWYLVYIGTKPEARGKGYARALIENVTKVVSQSPTSMSCSLNTGHFRLDARDPHFLSSVLFQSPKYH